MSRWSWRATRVQRSAWYTCSRSARSISARPRMASCSRPGPTSRPASRRIRPKVTSLRVTASPGFMSGSAGFADKLSQAGVADALDVLVVLQHRAERGVHHAGVELLLAEGEQGLRPVDRLGNAGRLGEVEPAQLLHEGGGLGRQSLR